jgi:hypothetical protein
VSAVGGDAPPLPARQQPASCYITHGYVQEYHVIERYAIFLFRLKVIDFGFVNMEYAP